MFQLSIAGRLGRDAEYREGQNDGGRCSFAVACDVGFGDRKQTYWVDVTRWGKGAQGLAGILRKGSSVAVTGELSTREHNGKTYLQLRADSVTILGGKPEGQRQEPRQEAAPADLDDEIPF
jgi:single-strand DNA-binding protein